MKNEGFYNNTRQIFGAVLIYNQNDFHINLSYWRGSDIREGK